MRRRSSSLEAAGACCHVRVHSFRGAAHPLSHYRLFCTSATGTRASQWRCRRKRRLTRLRLMSSPPHLRHRLYMRGAALWRRCLPSRGHEAAALLLTTLTSRAPPSQLQLRSLGCWCSLEKSFAIDKEKQEGRPASRRRPQSSLPPATTTDARSCGGSSPFLACRSIVHHRLLLLLLLAATPTILLDLSLLLLLLTTATSIFWLLF